MFLDLLNLVEVDGVMYDLCCSKGLPYMTISPPLARYRMNSPYPTGMGGGTD